MIDRKSMGNKDTHIQTSVCYCFEPNDVLNAGEVLINGCRNNDNHRLHRCTVNMTREYYMAELNICRHVVLMGGEKVYGIMQKQL